MKNKKMILFLLGILFSLSFVSASITIDIDMKESFGIDEEIFFDYTIVSEEDIETEYVPYVICPDAALPLIASRTAQLNANVPFEGKYVYMSELSDDEEPQTCNASVGIIRPEEVIEVKSFKISTNPGYEFSVLSCKDIDCKKKAKVFILDDFIYFDYSSSVEDLNVIGSLRFPDESIQKLTLPTSIKAEQTGNFEMEVTASKEGYKTIKKKILFAVIEEAAEFQLVNMSDVGKKEEEVSSKTEIREEIDEQRKGRIWWYIASIFVAIVVFIVVKRKFGRD